MEKYIKQFEKCLQHEPAFCSVACPFNMDVDAFISRLREGRFNAAYKTYRDATGFPFIAAEICSEQCKKSCLNYAVLGGNSDSRSGDPIELLALERATLKFASRTEPTSYNVPGKGKSVAIVGAGISGMACALRLATKKYNVTIFEKSNRLGGTLWDEIDPEILQKDFARQFQHLEYNIKFNSEVTCLEDLIKQGFRDNEAAAEANISEAASVMRAHTICGARGFSGTYDAIYVATGKGGNDFDVKEGDSLCTLIDKTAVFLGGSLAGVDKIHALADGLRIATAIDNYTLTNILKYPEYQPSEIVIDETQYIETNVVKGEAYKSGTPEYSKEEAIEEAKRCMKCQCNACRLHCDLTDYLHKWPLRLKDEIIATTAPGKSELHATPAVRTINICTHCGLCRETCPESIDIDRLIQSARVRMHKLGKMPWGFNDFFLRDMEFSNSESAYISFAPGSESNKCKYVFFPGCQLGASSPELVIKSYELLQSLCGSAGIMLGCCSVPAQWAGDEDLQNSVLAKIRSEWEAFGQPIMVLACPTCKKTFDSFLPEIQTVYLYDVFAESDNLPKLVNGGIRNQSNYSHRTYSVFDPCATSPKDSVRSSIRKICQMLEIKLIPLPIQEKWTACCSYGGHGALADPEFARFVREKRINENDLPYITYCINCRDAFLQEGKEAAHILNLIFGIEPRQVTLTKRRENRIELREKLMRKYKLKHDLTEKLHTSESAKKHNGDLPVITLEMPDEVRQKLSDEYILEEEAADVVSFCEKTGRTLYDAEANTYTGYRKIGNLTYWVTYRRPGDSSAPDKMNTYELLNAYTHRMEIELEMIWNGEKIDIEG